MILQQFENTADLNQQFSEQLVQILKQAIIEKNHALMVVSGGNTPKALFKKLAQQKLPWEKVSILLADERMVESAHPDRNEKMLQENLLIGDAKAAQLISLYDKAREFDTIEKQIHNLPVFDAVILGMGDDGHTASIFPCSEQIEKALSSQAATIMVQPQNAPHARISLTRARLMKHRHMFLHIVGENKKKVLQQAFQTNNPLQYPISAFSNDEKCHLQVMYARS